MKLSRLHIDEKGSPFYPENRVDNPKQKSLRAIYRTIDLLKEGIPKTTVEGILIEEKLATKATKEEVFARACNIIDEVFSKDHKTILGIHLSRYNKDIEDLFFQANNDYADIELIKYKIKAYMTAMDVMYAKERLLQFHKRASIVKVTQKNNIKVSKKPKEYFNLSKLSLEESIELLHLLDKSLITEDDDLPVLIATEEKEQTEQFTEVEVIETNVEKIKQIVPKQEEIDQNIPSLFNIKQKLRETFAKIAEEEFKKAGSKDGPIIKDYTKK